MNTRLSDVRNFTETDIAVNAETIPQPKGVKLILQKRFLPLLISIGSHAGILSIGLSTSQENKQIEFLTEKDSYHATLEISKSELSSSNKTTEQENETIKASSEINKLFQPLQAKLANKYKHLFQLKIVPKNKYLQFTYDYLKNIQAATIAQKNKTSVSDTSLKVAVTDIKQFENFINEKVNEIQKLKGYNRMSKVEKLNEISKIINKIPYKVDNSNPVDHAKDNSNGMNCDAKEVVASLLVKSILPNLKLTSKASIINGTAHINLVADNIYNIDTTFSTLDNNASGATGGERIKYYLGIFQENKQDVATAANQTYTNSVKSHIAVSEQIGANTTETNHTNTEEAINQQNKLETEILNSSSKELKSYRKSILEPDKIKFRSVNKIIRKIEAKHILPIDQIKILKRISEFLFGKEGCKTLKQSRIFKQGFMQLLYSIEKGKDVESNFSEKLNKFTDNLMIKIKQKYSRIYDENTNSIASSKLIQEKELFKNFSIHLGVLNSIGTYTGSPDLKVNIHFNNKNEFNEFVELFEIINNLSDETSNTSVNLRSSFAFSPSKIEIISNVSNNINIELNADNLDPINLDTKGIYLNRSIKINSINTNTTNLAKSGAIINATPKILNKLSENYNITVNYSDIFDAETQPKNKENIRIYFSKWLISDLDFEDTNQYIDDIQDFLANPGEYKKFIFEMPEDIQTLQKLFQIFINKLPFDKLDEVGLVINERYKEVLLLDNNFKQLSTKQNVNIYWLDKN